MMYWVLGFAAASCFFLRGVLNSAHPWIGVCFRYMIAVLDATVFPANAKALANVAQLMSTVLAMNPKNNVAHVQLPVLQTNTNTTALVTHRRKLEDALLSARLDTSTSVVLHFAKSGDATAADKRGGIQACLVLTQDPKQCNWVFPQVIGPIPLVRVADMVGYDAENRPSPSARAEQNLYECLKLVPFFHDPRQ